MTTVWIAIAAVAAVSFAIKALGPAVLGDHRLPLWSMSIIALLAPALLAGLVVSDVAGEGWKTANLPLVIGIAATLAARWRAPALLAVGVGIVVTAGTRVLLG